MKLFATVTIASLVVVSAACASSPARGGTTAAEPAAGVALQRALDDLEPSRDQAAPTFPARLAAPATPRQANRLAARVISELGGEAHADLKLCVDGDGAVTRAEVARSSGIDALDAAFVAEARTWRYQALGAQATVCQKVEIAFRVTR